MKTVNNLLSLMVVVLFLAGPVILKASENFGDSGLSTADINYEKVEVKDEGNVLSGSDGSYKEDPVTLIEVVEDDSQVDQDGITYIFASADSSSSSGEANANNDFSANNAGSSNSNGQKGENGGDSESSDRLGTGIGEREDQDCFRLYEDDDNGQFTIGEDSIEFPDDPGRLYGASGGQESQTNAVSVQIVGTTGSSSAQLTTQSSAISARTGTASPASK